MALHRNGFFTHRNIAGRRMARILHCRKETARNGFNEATLAVLDTETGDETNYCLSVGNFEDTSMVIYDLVWSLDGKSLVTIVNRDEVGNFDTVLIDLERGIVMKIAENPHSAGMVGYRSKMKQYNLKIIGDVYYHQQLPLQTESYI